MRFIFLCVLLAYSFSINAQKRLLPIVENGCHGFIDTPSVFPIKKARRINAAGFFYFF
jgi:hypothetical protein